MIREKRLLCVLFALVLCAGCTAAPQQNAAMNTPAPLDTPAPTDAPADTPEPLTEAVALATETPVETEETEEPESPTAPAPEATPSPTPEPVMQERLDAGEFDSFFDDALFLGDSITESLDGYVRYLREAEGSMLGTTQMFGVKAMNVHIACQDEPAPLDRTFRYRGKAVSVSEIINLCGPRRVFILMGVNDVCDRPWEDVAADFGQLIDNIHTKCPGVEVIIQGILPISAEYCTLKGITIERYNSFNESVLAGVCEEHDAGFLNFSELMMDENGYLIDRLCNDRQYHLSWRGELVWVRALRAYAAQQMIPGAEVIFNVDDYTKEDE